MSHSSSINLIIFIVIVLITVALYGGSMMLANSESCALLTFIGAFSLKVVVDDYVHFNSFFAPLDEKEITALHKSLIFSFLIYTLLAICAAQAAMNHTEQAEIFFVLIMLVGSTWMYENEKAIVAHDIGAIERHRGWALINIVYTIVLTTDFFCGGANNNADWMFYLLALMVFVHASCFGSLRNLATLDGNLPPPR